METLKKYKVVTLCTAHAGGNAPPELIKEILNEPELKVLLTSEEIKELEDSVSNIEEERKDPSFHDYCTIYFPKSVPRHHCKLVEIVERMIALDYPMTVTEIDKPYYIIDYNVYGHEHLITDGIVFIEPMTKES